MKAARWIVLVFALAAVGFLCGAAASRFFRPQPAVAQEDSGAITARQFQILDGNGKTRMLLATDDDDNTPSVTFYDAKENYRSIYNLSAAGEPLLAMYGANGKIRTAFAVTDADGEEITFYDKTEKPTWTAH